MQSAPTVPDLRVDVDEEQVASFVELGYLAVERITTDEEVEWLRGVFDEVMQSRSAGLPGTVFDVARPYGTDGGDDLFTQALFPEVRFPELRDTIYARNARRISARLLGVEEEHLVHWGHMLSKPARIGEQAPWHQDEAYWDPTLDYRAVGAWLPLDDADVDNGCLWFVPGSHRSEVLAHRHVGGDPSVHLLELVEPPDTSGAVPVPTRAGGATFHHPRMLHHSRPNTTDADRRAYANEFQTVPRPRAAPADRPWLAEGERARDHRKGDDHR